MVIVGGIREKEPTKGLTGTDEGCDWKVLVGVPDRSGERKMGRGITYGGHAMH